MSTEENSQWRRVWKRMNQVPKIWWYAGVAGVVATTLSSPKIYQAAGLIFTHPETEVQVEQPANQRWGLDLNQYQLQESALSKGDILGKILQDKGLNAQSVLKLVENAKNAGFNITSMRMGKNLYFLTGNGQASASLMIYEPSPYEFVKFQLTEPYQVEIVQRSVETKIVASSGVLESSFWQALVDNDLSDELADGMIDILATSVDFYHQKQGDRFKVVYEKKFVEGQPVGTGKILAAVYERDGKEYFAFNFDKEGLSCKYYDNEGRPARKAFLKSPLKYSRISSRYNLNRLHPVLGYHKAHFGTDYAAPYGTPIMAVADGTVVEATRRGGNGNFVRIRHDKTYETQYLHMQGFAKGVRAGTRVVQGQTIGYVGSTGLATGPHVCFRFWKGGRQVDHLRLNLPSPEPIKGKDLEEFSVVREALKKQLEAVPYTLRQTGARP